MPFHVDRFSLSFTEVVGKDASSVLGIRLSEYSQAKTPANKARFMRRLMDRLLVKTSKREANKVMLECGYMMRDGVSRCINENRIKRTKALYAESRGMKDFIERYNKHGGGSLRLEGKSIKATYDRCYCGSVSRAKEKIPLTYCYCGAGWYKRLFEEVLSMPVKVKVLKSIANGAERCEIEVRI